VFLWEWAIFDVMLGHAETCSRYILNVIRPGQYYFSARIINIWNSLPNCVVDVSTINQLKARLDKFWSHQDILYDYTADLTGIGDRSVHVTKDE